MMEGYGVSQQTDEGYSEDPLNPPESSSFAAPYKSRDGMSTSNPLAGASSAQSFAWMTAHIAGLPTDLRARA